MPAGGFAQYEKDAQITPAFLKDFEVFCEKVYSHWSLAEDFDEFYASCVAKLPTSLAFYDPTKGSVATFVFQVIQNEATRLYSKFRKYVLTDIDTLFSQDAVSPFKGYSSDADLYLRGDILTFAQYAWGLGVYVDQEVVYYGYKDQVLTPVVKAFIWLRRGGG